VRASTAAVIPRLSEGIARKSSSCTPWNPFKCPPAAAPTVPHRSNTTKAVILCAPSRLTSCSRLASPWLPHSDQGLIYEGAFRKGVIGLSNPPVVVRSVAMVDAFGLGVRVVGGGDSGRMA
jgi:hypothetical protein